MTSVKAVVALAFSLLAGACVTTETVSFQAGPKQQALTRDGKQALVSAQGKSMVMVSPSSRGINAGQRPVYVLGINNLSKKPIDFRVDQVSVVQLEDGKPKRGLRVVTYENLVREEKNRQIAAAIFTGLGAAANAYSASQAGYQRSYGTVHATTYTPRGTYHSTGYVSATTYNPALASAAMANAQAQNNAMISDTMETGRQNLAALEEGVIKDHTLLPGEWYGGQLHFEPPLEVDGGGAKSYAINVTIDGETHVITAQQAPAKS
ncbi:hypothetical protein GCM10007276_31060 [Agaricicola taiwanensis]|uniref:Lipoprotein n=1 Tax=Agaricicola taiwanensis TaxID=591372 RepID=A0A8J2YLC4_9RHOB|nr:hypothetical protein [Agaricicola taiwanensis]GGE51790.1 hypothetical protein GCM10007276_31060 [Agaricicola taiwanensis]